MQVLKPHLDRFRTALNFLKMDLPNVRNGDVRTWDAFLRNSSLSDTEAQSAVTFGTQPPLLFAQNLGSFTWAQFDPIVPNRIELSREVMQHFAADAARPEAQKFLRAKVLHEMCHWGRFRARLPDPDEAGETFEKEAFGKELTPWWLGTITASAPGVQTEFTNGATRALALQTALARSGHVDGREKDPAHRIFAGVDVAEGLARGYRNNNPGNIRIGQPWAGLAEPTDQTDFQRRETAFCVFLEPEWGLRAMGRLLRRYKNELKVDTPRRIIERWAPASDNNNVESYGSQLAKALGVTPDTIVDANDEEVLIRMMTAIAAHENGSKPPYADVQFRAAVALI